MGKPIDPQQEERAIVHIIDGVFMDELSPEGRARVVTHLCDVYVKDWPGTPPGFTPWGRLREGKKQHFDDGQLFHARVMPIILGATSLASDANSLRGDLLLTDEGRLLFDHHSHPGGKDIYHLKVCTKEQFLQLVTNPNYYGIIIRKLRTGLKKKRENLVRELALTDEKLGILGRVSDEWRGDPS
jgi:hypothetical protein